MSDKSIAEQKSELWRNTMNKYYGESNVDEAFNKFNAGDDISDVCNTLLHGAQTTTAREKEVKLRKSARGKFKQCGACQVMQKKCSPDCILAPYYPPSEIEKFKLVSNFYGEDNVLELFNSVEVAEERVDVCNVLFYGAEIRLLDDPILYQVRQYLKEGNSELESKFTRFFIEAVARENKDVSPAKN